MTRLAWRTTGLLAALVGTAWATVVWWFAAEAGAPASARLVTSGPALAVAAVATSWFVAGSWRRAAGVDGEAAAPTAAEDRKPRSAAPAITAAVVAALGLGVLASVVWSQAGLDERLQEEAAELAIELAAMEDPVNTMLLDAARFDVESLPGTDLYFSEVGVIVQRSVTYGLLDGCVTAEIVQGELAASTSTRQSCAPPVGASS